MNENFLIFQPFKWESGNTQKYVLKKPFYGISQQYP